MKAVKLRMMYWRWHRRIGLFSILVLIILSLTGLLLNHTVGLKLDAKSIKSPWLLKAYGIEIPQFKGLQTPQGWLSSVSGDIYLDEHYLTACEGALVAALQPRNLPFWLFACGEQVFLFTADNQLVERIDQLHGLPTPISNLGNCDGEICFIANQQQYRADFNALTWTPVETTIDSKMPLKAVPESLQAFYRSEFSGEDLNWERVILDIHAARFLGSAGPWILDIFVLLFLFLSFSGFYLWYSHGRKPSKAKRSRRI